ncbi:hypothetical protein ABT124_40625 [Streptomyces sp. NPDC001982]|uniref:hypothetical protein n=1 Tax=Streptomyces sp. NPDC001982 TaxID=3154405 RepID=UPI003332F9C6
MDTEGGDPDEDLARGRAGWSGDIHHLEDIGWLAGTVADKLRDMAALLEGMFGRVPSFGGCR